MKFFDRLLRQPERIDPLSRDTRQVLDAIASGDDRRVEEAFADLAPHPTGDVIAELCVWVQDTTDGMNLDGMLTATTVPLPDHAKAVIEAVLSLDLNAWVEPVRKAHPDLVEERLLGKALNELFTIIVALRDSRFRIHKRLDYAEEYVPGTAQHEAFNEIAAAEREAQTTEERDALTRAAGNHLVDGIDPVVAEDVKTLTAMMVRLAESHPARPWSVRYSNTLGPMLTVQDKRHRDTECPITPEMGQIANRITAALEAHNRAGLISLRISVENGSPVSMSAYYDNWTYDDESPTSTDLTDFDAPAATWRGPRHHLAWD